jgi:dCMP deaminase
MIIGITGYYASGKDTVAEYLAKRNFENYSLSDEIRIEARKRKITVGRDNLIKLGNELREKFGPGALAERISIRMNEDKDYVITSIRNPAEVDVLAREPNFILISVEASQKKRFGLLQERARDADPASFEEFIDKEKIEQSADPNKQQLDKCQKMAKITLTNEGSLEELYDKVDLLLLHLNKKYRQRPSWDDYFIRISREVAKRATCDRGKSGCVIVREKRLLCTGYVGSAAGLSHCDEIGHQIKEIKHEDGTSSKHCVRTIHAEQNAICQAAKEGISLKDATLYCKMEPCSVCAKMISNCGISRVVCEKKYHGARETREIFKQAKIDLSILDDTVESYARM